MTGPRLRLPALLLIMSLLAACTAGGSPPSPTPRGKVGGTLRLGMVNPAFGQMDPQLEWAANTWELFRCCLLRTLMSYNGLGGPSSALPQPDLASGPPDVSIDGLTWTFHLRPGLYYGPPLQAVPITSSDIVRAFLRAGDPKIGNLGVSPLFDIVAGFSSYASGKSQTISGLETPDPLTLRIHETRPDAILPYILAMATTAPIPPLPGSPNASFGVAIGHDPGTKAPAYGRFLVASGPYMYEGSAAMNFSVPPAQQTPAGGFVPWVVRGNSFGGFNTLQYGSITLVRNPSWNPATDPLRAALPDRIEIRGGSEDALFGAVRSGTLDMVYDNVAPPAEVRRYQADSALRPLIETTDGVGVTLATFNMAQPPMDDVAVRRAISYALDRAAVLRASRGNYRDDLLTLANHLSPDTTEAALLAAWSPFPGANGAGDLQAARKALEGSRYAKGGRCVVAACRRITALVHPGLEAAIPSVRAALAALGIRADFGGPNDFWKKCLVPSSHVAMCIGMGWSADFPNADNILGSFFSSSGLGIVNDSLFGASPAQLAGWGYSVRHVPSVDGDVERCVREVGPTQPACWAALDQFLLTQYWPAVPLVFIQPIRLSSPKLGNFAAWDEPYGEPALDRLSVSSG